MRGVGSMHGIRLWPDPKHGVQLPFGVGPQSDWVHGVRRVHGPRPTYPVTSRG